jgi:crotonobetainyl-CoA:carnitine CoA-transferase CaiB-like acyl-CoA transferase
MADHHATPAKVAAAQALLRTPEAQALLARQQADIATAVLDRLRAVIASPAWKDMLAAVEAARDAFTDLPLARLHLDGMLRSAGKVEGQLPAIGKRAADLEAAAGGTANG